VTAKGLLKLGPGGEWEMDLPLKVTLLDTVFTIPGAKEAALQRLDLPIGIKGRLTHPTITFDDKAFSEALIKAGRKELADLVKKRASKLLKGTLPGAANALGGVIDGTKKPEDAVKDALEEAKRKTQEKLQKRVQEEAKKKLDKKLKKALPGGLGGLFGKKKKKKK